MQRIIVLFYQNNDSTITLISEYMCHIYVRGDGLCCVLTADHEYPQRVAHTLLTKVGDIISFFHEMYNNVFHYNRCLMILLHELNHRFGQKETQLAQPILDWKHLWQSIKTPEKLML